MTPARDEVDLRAVDATLRERLHPWRDRLSSGNWLAGAITLAVLTAVLTWGLLHEAHAIAVHRATCAGVLAQGTLDKDRLEFLGKHCVGSK